MHVVIWQYEVSLHVSALIRALVERGVAVTTVVQEQLSSERMACGWTIPDLGDARVIISPDDNMIERLAAEETATTVHIFGGARGHRLGWVGMRYCRKHRARMGLMTEAADGEGWRGWARRVKYTTECLWRGASIDFILAMGELGRHWFRQCGYPEAKIYPFAYFLEPPMEVAAGSAATDRVELMYLGRCVPGKGVERLFNALERCRGMDWRCTVIGDGLLKDRWQQRVLHAGLGERVRFLGTLPHDDAMRYLSQMDLLLLPSDAKDGWGAVVNEALLRGVPALCSDACGAAVLLRDSWRGQVVEAGSDDSLTAALQHRIAWGKRSPELSQRVASWASCLTGAAGAAYLLGILCHVYEGSPRPLPPWEEKTTVSRSC